MSKDKFPMTLAVRELQTHQVEFTHHLYDYVEKGGTSISSSSLGMPEHTVVKTISPCKPELADRHSGYQVGGMSPFGTRKKMPIYMEESIAGLEKIYINGGKRGYLVGVAPSEVIRVLKPTLVQVATSES